MNDSIRKIDIVLIVLGLVLIFFLSVYQYNEWTQFITMILLSLALVTGSTLMGIRSLRRQNAAPWKWRLFLGLYTAQFVFYFYTILSKEYYLIQAVAATVLTIDLLENILLRRKKEQNGKEDV